MPELKHKRKFWQFHLSTAILLSLTVGCLIWQNVSWKLLKIRIYDLKDDYELFGANAPVTEYQYGRGWPLMFQFRPVYFFQRWFEPYLVCDIIIALGILFLIGLVSELLIRRREGRKT